MYNANGQSDTRKKSFSPQGRAKIHRRTVARRLWPGVHTRKPDRDRRRAEFGQNEPCSVAVSSINKCGRDLRGGRFRGWIRSAFGGAGGRRTGKSTVGPLWRRY